MKSSLPILFCIVVLVCPLTIWSQSTSTASAAAVQFENISVEAPVFLQASSEIEKGQNFRALCHRISERQAAATNTENVLLRSIQQAMTTYESNLEFRAQLLRNPADCLARLRASASLEVSR